MFRVNRIVVYPVHGAGKILKKYTPRGSKERYYQIDLFDSDISVSVPVKNAETLGLRYPTSEKQMRKLLKQVGATKKISEELESNLPDITRDLLYTGKVSDSIEALNLLLSVQRKCERDNRRLSTTAQDTLRKIQDFLVSEIKVSVGDSLISVVSEDKDNK